MCHPGARIGGGRQLVAVAPLPRLYRREELDHLVRVRARVRDRVRDRVRVRARVRVRVRLGSG